MMNTPNTLDELITLSRSIAQQGLCPGTAGNFSLRHAADEMLVSGSGRDKRQLAATDFVRCNLQGQLVSGTHRPSDEAALHGKIYQLFEQAQCVLHTHSVPVTVLSMHSPHPFIRFHGWEMQKTISGITSHDATVDLTILDNSQDMAQLADALEKNWARIQPTYGFIVKGHGLYSWGTSIFQAQRHMEGLEFLAACLLQSQMLKNGYPEAPFS